MLKNYFILQFFYIEDTTQLMLRAQDQLELSDKSVSVDTTSSGHYECITFDTYFNDVHDFIYIYPLDKNFDASGFTDELERVRNDFNSHLVVKLPDSLSENRSSAVIQLIAAQLGADKWRRLASSPDSSFEDNIYINLFSDLEILTQSELLD